MMEVKEEIVGQDFHKEDPEVVEVVFVPGVKEIGLNAFRKCLNLRKVKIPGTVEKIANCAFMMCKSLEAVEFENGLKHIGNNAFWKCVALKSVQLPQSLETIGEAAFAECANLGEVVGLGDRMKVDPTAFAGTPYLDARPTVPPELAKRVEAPAEVIAYFNSPGMEHWFGRGPEHAITEVSQSWIVLKRYFEKPFALHVEILAYRDGINVEFHSENDTPPEVHQFLIGQDLPGFAYREHQPKNGTFRFATRRVECVGRPMKEVLEDLREAVEALCRDFVPYLDYVEKYWNSHSHDMSNCRMYGEGRSADEVIAHADWFTFEDEEYILLPIGGRYYVHGEDPNSAYPSMRYLCIKEDAKESDDGFFDCKIAIGRRSDGEFMARCLHDEFQVNIAMHEIAGIVTLKYNPGRRILCVKILHTRLPDPSTVIADRLKEMGAESIVFE